MRTRLLDRIHASRGGGERVVADVNGRVHGAVRLRSAYFTASLTAFTGRARTALLAGFAANVCSCLVNGLMPLRAGRAGFFTTVNFAKPWSTNTPAFFSSLWAKTTRCSTPPLRCFFDTSSPTASAMALRISLLDRGFVFLVVAGFA